MHGPPLNTLVSRFPLLCLLLFAAAAALAQEPNLKVVSWNIADLGRTKSDAEIELMASVLRGYDVIAIQEVVAKDPAGARAVARLAAALDRRGADYDYRVSDPTRSSSGAISERYAFLWRTGSIQLRGRPQLMAAYAKTVEREPYLATFRWRNKDFRVINFHARPHDHQPEREIAAMRSAPDDYPDAPLLFLGDFNVVSRHSVFGPWIRRGYELGLSGQATTLRRERPRGGGDVYASESDNILVPTDLMRILERGILDVVGFCGSVKAQRPNEWPRSAHGLALARQLSDHAPVYVVLEGY